MDSHLDFLIGTLLAEYPQKNVRLPDTDNEKKNLFRALMNLRSPKEISEDFLDVQDIYLQEESVKSGVVKTTDLSSISTNPRIVLWQGSITRLCTDAIVNAANKQMLGCFIPNHSCIDNAIHSAAGLQLRASCKATIDRMGHYLSTGTAQITPAFNLPCKYVIHTVGPIIDKDVTEKDITLLADCYRNSLKIADTLTLKTIAFPCISTGEFRFPNQLAARIAVKTVSEYLDSSESGIETIIFNVFKDIDHVYYSKLLG